MAPPPAGPSWKVYTLDNFLRTAADVPEFCGEFATVEEAITEARALLRASLESCYSPGMDTSLLYQTYADIGEEVIIVPRPKELLPIWCWGLAQILAGEICGAQKTPMLPAAVESGGAEGTPAGKVSPLLPAGLTMEAVFGISADGTPIIIDADACFEDPARIGMLMFSGGKWVPADRPIDIDILQVVSESELVKAVEARLAIPHHSNP